MSRPSILNSSLSFRKKKKNSLLPFPIFFFPQFPTLQDGKKVIPRDAAARTPVKKTILPERVQVYGCNLGSSWPLYHVLSYSRMNTFLRERGAC